MTRGPYQTTNLSKKYFAMALGLVNKLGFVFGWLRLRLAASAKLGLPTSRPAFYFLASLVLAHPKTKPNLFTSPKLQHLADSLILTTIYSVSKKF